MSNNKTWLFFIFQIPPKPAYIRVKLWRSLKTCGAIPFKGSVYILPESKVSRENFEWVRKQLMADGGSATIFSTSPVSGLSDSQLRGLFQTARLEDYQDWIKGAERHLRSTGKKISKSLMRDMEISLAQIQAIDFFGTAKTGEALKILASLKKKDEPRKEQKSLVALSAKAYKNKLWVTRQGLHIDRLACAWFIKRFIDPKAKFKFVEASQYQHQPSEIRFDMFEAEFTHVGDLCSFEVLVQRFKPKDLGLVELSKIIHDLDINDNKYQRSETLGISQIVKGIVQRYQSDEERIGQASEVFENIYLGFNQ